MSALVQRSARVDSSLGPLTVFAVEASPGSAPPAPSVAVLVDLSGSLAGPPGERALRAAQALLAALPDSRHGALILAGDPPVLVAPLGPLGAQRPALAAPRNIRRGGTTVARALDLIELELARSARPAAVVIFSDLLWGTDVLPALARIEARGATTIVVEATSAFTPPTPTRAPRFVLAEADPAVAKALEDAVQASARPAGWGTLGVELDGAPPLAWFVGDERAAGGTGLVARAPVELGAARLVFLTAGEPRGSVLLALAGEKLVRVPLQATGPLEGAGAFVKPVLGGAT